MTGVELVILSIFLGWGWTEVVYTEPPAICYVQHESDEHITFVPVECDKITIKD